MSVRRTSLLWSFIVVAALTALCSASFRNRTILQLISGRSSGTFFGYSVQLIKPSSPDGEPMVLVGAPRANSTKYKEIREPGVVFTCKISKNAYSNDCKSLLLDPDGGNTERVLGSGLNYKHKREGQWLGGAIDVRDDKLVVCAHRWSNQKYQKYLFQNGMCYWLQATSMEFADKKAVPLMPVLNIRRQGFTHRQNNTATSYYYYAYAEVGSAVHLTKTNDNVGQVLLGAPGFLHWKGSVIKYNEGALGITDASIPNPLNLKPLEFFSYMGYSLSSGRFFLNNTLRYVTSAPRGKELLGQVFLFDYHGNESIIIHYEANGREMGEYFGAAVTAADVTGDGIDDLIIGAPTYSADKIDAGCVYVLISNGQGDFKRQAIDGVGLIRARYGTALSAIGDINSDGYVDVAIGAPHDGPLGEGVVYIHLGSPTGLREQPYHRISGQNVNRQIRGFGCSISKGMDIDGNHINDMAIGAYISDHVVIVRHRPVVHLNVSLISSLNKLSLDEEDQKPHKLQITACLKYTGKHLPSQLIFNMSLISDPIYGRTDINNTRERIICLIEQACCLTKNVTVIQPQKSFQRIYHEPLEFRLTGELDHCEGHSCPVLANEQDSPTYVPPVSLLTVAYETNCGSDHLCEPELEIIGNWIGDLETVVVGSHLPLEAAFHISNKGEPAFLCILYAKTKVPLLNMPERCQQFDSDTIQCYLGNPLTTMRSLTLKLDTSQVSENDEPVSLEVNVVSVGTESNLTDNVISLSLPLSIEVNVEVGGFPEPDQYSFSGETNDELNINETVTYEISDNQDKNVTVLHQIEVRSKGPSPLDVLQIDIFVPWRVAGQEITRDIVVVKDIDASGDQPVRCNERSENIMLDLPIAGDLKVLSTLPENRTAILGCAVNRSTETQEGSNNPECVQYTCITERPHNTSYVTFIIIKLMMTVDIEMLDIWREEKDLIVFTTTALVSSPRIQSHNYQNLSTVFVGYLRSGDIIKWIIIGCIAGIILLIITIFILYKAGFFRRKTLEKLASEKEHIVSEQDDEEEENEC